MRGNQAFLGNVEAQILAGDQRRGSYASTQDRRILASMYRETIMTLPRIRRFARRTRDFCRVYFVLEIDVEGAESKDNIEKMRKICKANRIIIVMEQGFLGRH